MRARTATRQEGRCDHRTELRHRVGPTDSEDLNIERNNTGSKKKCLEGVKHIYNVSSWARLETIQASSPKLQA